jgi:hypothetical protein
LKTYQETRPWARSIKNKVSKREMPPWFIDKSVGVEHFSNDRSLTDRDIQTIMKWVDAGAPEGNAADMPPPRQFPDADAWQIGKPDVIVSLPNDVIVAAKAPDRRSLHQGCSDHSGKGLHGHPPHSDLDRRADGYRSRQRPTRWNRWIARSG